MDSVIRERYFLIIEDSAAVALLLKEYLKKLGIGKIQSFENGKKGIAGFKTLVKTKNDPVVFLDYNLPDMNGFSVMTQLIKVKPDVKVIIETALDRSEQSIKDVIKALPKRDEKILRLRFGIIEDSKDHENWPITEEEMRALEQRKNEQ